MAYTTGDTVVHPRHGVAKVHKIATRGAGKAATSYLELVFATSLKIMVPVDSVDEIGLRRLPTKSEAEKILAILAEPSDVPEAWAERHATTSSRVKTTELAEASRVIRDLTRHAQRSDKPLSTAENSVLQSCLDSVSMELSLALEITQDEARDLIVAQAELAH